MPEKPHIVIVARGGSGWLGGRQYAINLVRALITNREDIDAYDVSVLVKGADELVHYEALRPNLRVAADTGSLFRPWTLNNRVRWKIKRTFQGWTNPRLEEPLFALGATFAYPISSAVVPSADWISDFQYHYFPDRMSAAEIGDRKAEFSYIVEHAQRIALSSFCAERDCHLLYPSSKERTNVLQFRAFAEDRWMTADTDKTLKQYHLPDRFALVSNWLLPTKNHCFVLDALAEVPPAERRNMHIVFTGDIYDYRNPGFYNSFLNRIHKLGLREQVSHLGVIPKHDQIQLLRAATAYLQPSLFEGWNTGIEEARLFGKRMLLSDIPVHREQSPQRATFFDPSDPTDLADKLRDQFGSPESEHQPRVGHESIAMEDYQRLQREFAQSFLSISSSVTA
jgi:glycosyltransferase involved in cell wall biosynthesis